METEITLLVLDVDTIQSNGVDVGIQLDLILLLAAHDVPALDHLESSLREALTSEHYEHLYAIAFGLLDHYPALGMLFARGCMMEERSLDSDMLMHSGK